MESAKNQAITDTYNVGDRKEEGIVWMKIHSRKTFGTGDLSLHGFWDIATSADPVNELLSVMPHLLVQRRRGNYSASILALVVSRSFLFPNFEI